MRILVCVKYVPVLSALRFDPETRRLVRDGVRGELSGFDVRALLGALALKSTYGGKVVALTMGPPSAREGLVHCLALGADQALHLIDPGLAGSDTLATSRALAAAIRHEAPDLVMMGRASVDAETGQVGPQVAELLDWPQATVVRRVSLDLTDRTFDAERETDEGFELVTGPIPAVLTAAEDLAEERFPSKADRLAAAEKPITELGLADVGLQPSDVGTEGSPTWVAGIEEVRIERRAEAITGDSPEAIAHALHDRLTALGAFDASAVARQPLAIRGPATGPPLWVVVEAHDGKLRAVTLELLAKAAELAGPLGADVEAVVIGPGAEHAAVLAAGGADRVLVADAPGLEPYTTDAHAAVLAEAIRTRAPRLVLLGSTVRGRDLAPRVAARLGLGLTGDAVDLDLDGEGRVRQLKPAFGGAIIAPILSRTRPEMATVRPGMLHPALPDASRRAELLMLDVPEVPVRVRVVDVQPIGGEAEDAFETATLVLGVGKGIGGPTALPAIRDLAGRLGAALAATREVTDAGWMPRQYQVGLTGRAIAPRLYVGLGVSGAMEHMVGLRRAGIIVAINKSPKSPVLKVADLGIVADLNDILPHLEMALRP
ncbi:MAG TPA: FAD-binding protein [Candidatus Binatia bacterium]|jgi:electron transfer flavoprotein alpha subunit|nr:FAD-binding protein [Candidatus Binatia bacterium]